MAWQHISEILPGVLRIEEGGFVAWHLLKGRDRAVLIDTGWGVTDCWNLAADLAGNRELLAVVTHLHPDHATGNGHCRWTAVGEREWPARTTARRAGSHLLAWATGLLPADYDPAAYDDFCDQGPPVPDRRLADGDVLELGDLHLVTHLCPGHTAGHCVFTVPERGIVFGGDMLLKSQLWLHLRGSTDPATTFASFAGLRPLAATTRHLLTSHGPTDLPGSFITELADDLERVRDGLRDPVWKETFAGGGWYYDFGGHGALFAERL